MSETLTFHSETPQGKSLATPGTVPTKESSVERVKVVVRCRPPTNDEGSAPTCCKVDPAANEVSLHDPRGLGLTSAKIFTFDAVYGATSTQAEVYNGTARPIVDSVLSGYNGTIFAYGQTGTGKTFTMEGTTEPGQAGLIPSAFNQVFETIGHSSDTQFLVRASFLEIYNEQVRDLLGKDPSARLELKEHRDSGVYVKGLGSFVVKNVQEMTALLEVGKKNRSVGATAMNQDSSRSHSMFTIIVERTDQPNAAGGGHIKAGKLNLVDLAGSERQAKTQASGMRLKEATRINLSLSALGNVISALVDGNGGHVPYRDSKLTRLLQDSLGGNSRTVMLAAVGPSIAHYEETLSTLRYASRAKNIRNKPHINEDPKNALMREMQAEIAALRRQLAAAATGTPHSGEPSVPRTPEQDEALAMEFEQRVRMEVAARAEAVQKQEEAVKQRAAALQAEIKALREQKLTLQQGRLITADSTRSLDIRGEGERNAAPADKEETPADAVEETPSSALFERPAEASWQSCENGTAGAAGGGPLQAVHAADGREDGTAQASGGGYADVQPGNGDGLGLARAAGDGHVQAGGLGGSWDGRGAGGAPPQDVPEVGGMGVRPSTEIRGQAGAADLEGAARRSRRRPTSRRSSRADIEQRLAALEGTLLRGADTGEWAPAPGTFPLPPSELCTPSRAFQPVSSMDTNASGTPPRPTTGMPAGAWGSPSHATYACPSTGTPPRGTWGPPDQNLGSGSGPGAPAGHMRPSNGTWAPSWAAPQQGRAGGSGSGSHGLPTLAPLRGGHQFGGLSPEGARRTLPSLGFASMGERGSPYGLPGMTRFSDGYPISRHWVQETARPGVGREANWQDMWNPHAQGVQRSGADSQHFRGADQEDGMELVLRANVLEVECEAIADELARVAASWQAEKGSLMEELGSLQQDLALKDLIVSSFIPPREVEKLLARAVWDEDREEWVLQPSQGPAGGSPLAAWRERRLARHIDRSSSTPEGSGMEDSWTGPGPMSPGDADLAWGPAPSFANHQALHDSYRPHQPTDVNNSIVELPFMSGAAQIQWSEPLRNETFAQPPDMLLINAEEQPILLPNATDFDTP